MATRIDYELISSIKSALISRSTNATEPPCSTRRTGRSANVWTLVTVAAALGFVVPTPSTTTPAADSPSYYACRATTTKPSAMPRARLLRSTVDGPSSVTARPAVGRGQATVRARASANGRRSFSLGDGVSLDCNTSTWIAFLHEPLPCARVQHIGVRVPPSTPTIAPRGCPSRASARTFCCPGSKHRCRPSTRYTSALSRGSALRRVATMSPS